MVYRGTAHHAEMQLAERTRHRATIVSPLRAVSGGRRSLLAGDIHATRRRDGVFNY
jgi:hypothetical protein